MNGYKSTNRSRSEGATFLPPLNMAELPDHVDWRIKGYVTPVCVREKDENSITRAVKSRCRAAYHFAPKLSIKRRGASHH